MDIVKKSRGYICLILAVVSYYVLHEGAHLLSALIMGCYKGINLMGVFGVQIDVERDAMSDLQFGIFNLVGAVATAAAAYALVALTSRICSVKPKFPRSFFYYLTLVMLVLDPLYLSVVCGFVGGGDMNGIQLLLPQVVARSIFGVLLIINVLLFFRVVLPVYRKSFEE